MNPAVRIGSLVSVALAAGLCMAPACANTMTSGAAKLAHITNAGDTVPVVALGEEIGIACDALQYRAPGNDVRVVLTISAPPSSGTATGYRKVLATNQQLSKDAVHVRIPKIPDLLNHTVKIDVYVVSAKGARNCPAGRMRIADGASSKRVLDHRS